MDVQMKQRAAVRQREGGLGELIVTRLLLGALGALLGGAVLVFDVRPFGVAMAAGAGGAFPAVALGVAILALVRRDYLSLIALAAVALVRVVLSFFPERDGGERLPFEERPALRALFAALSLFGTGLFRVLRGGFRYYDLFALLLAVAAGALAAFLYSGAFEKKDALFPFSKEAGVAALALSTIFALRAVSLFGIYPAPVLAALIALFLAAHRGPAWGAGGALLAGLCFQPRLALCFPLLSLGFWLLQKSSRGGAIMAGGGAALALALMLSGSEGVALLLPALLTAGALFLACDSAGLVEGSATHRAGLTRRRAALQSARAARQSAGEARIKELSGALLELSGTLFELSSRQRRPGLAELRRLCDRAFDEVCPTCRHRDVCWGSEYNATATAVQGLGERLQGGTVVEQSHLPPALRARCPNAAQILDRINSGAVRLSGEALRGDKTSVVAGDYAALGRVLREALEEGEAAFCADQAAGERIAERLLRLGYHLESAAVCGDKRRCVILCGLRLPGRHLKIRELRRILEQHCRFSLGAPQCREGEGVMDLIFPECEQFSTRSIRQTRAKGRGDARYCGDTTATLKHEGGRDFALLCDGMGSGNTAALTSALAGSFLSRMLSAGNRADSALRMLNGFLAARSTREEEASTTVDLLEIDRVSGEAAFYKCGAAPSFLLRRGEVTRFFSRTAPVGILESLDAERIAFHVRTGDVILQVSDGVTKGEEDCLWLGEMLRTAWDGDADGFARKVLARAGEESKDDLSLILTEVGNADEGEQEGARATA